MSQHVFFDVSHLCVHIYDETHAWHVSAHVCHIYDEICVTFVSMTPVWHPSSNISHDSSYLYFTTGGSEGLRAYVTLWYVSCSWVWLLFDTPHITYFTRLIVFAFYNKEQRRATCLRDSWMCASFVTWLLRGMTHHIFTTWRSKGLHAYIMTRLIDMWLVREMTHVWQDSSYIYNRAQQRATCLYNDETHGCVTRLWHDSCVTWLILHLQ